MTFTVLKSLCKKNFRSKLFATSDFVRPAIFLAEAQKNPTALET